MPLPRLPFAPRAAALIAALGLASCGAPSVAPAPPPAPIAAASLPPTAAFDAPAAGDAGPASAIAETPAASAPITANETPSLKDGAAPHSLSKGDLADSGIDPAAFAALVEHATKEHSSAIVIVKDGKLVAEKYREGYDGAPLYAMSASKSVVSIAMGMLIADRKTTLDTRVGALFPEWAKQGKKGAITLRQLLNHTSGLDPSRAQGATETIRGRADDAKLLFAPGSRFQYNNGAVDFLAVAFQKAAGTSLDAYLDARLFRELDVVGAVWDKDSEGTPRGAGELSIRPVDLAKIGELMLENGSWGGQSIVPPSWVKRSVDAGQSLEEDCGLLWWREGKFAHALSEPVLAAWRDLGFADAAKKARPLVGRKFAKYSEYMAALREALGEDDAKKLAEAIAKGNHVPMETRVKDGPITGFAARGWLGQYLVVLPKQRLVAVRMRGAEPSDYKGDAEVNAYYGFAADVAKLAVDAPSR